MKKVTLTIKGIHVYGDMEDDAMEFVTEGELYNRGNTFYLLYDEGVISGVEGLKTRLAVKKDSVSVVRKGEAVGIDTEMKFIKGKRYTGIYDTGYGPVEMEVMTNDIKNNLNEDGDGQVEIDYNISLKGLVEGRSKMSIEVKS